MSHWNARCVSVYLMGARRRSASVVGNSSEVVNRSTSGSLVRMRHAQYLDLHMFACGFHHHIVLRYRPPIQGSSFLAPDKSITGTRGIHQTRMLFLFLFSIRTLLFLFRLSGDLPPCDAFSFGRLLLPKSWCTLTPSRRIIVCSSLHIVI